MFFPFIKIPWNQVFFPPPNEPQPSLFMRTSSPPCSSPVRAVGLLRPALLLTTHGPFLGPWPRVRREVCPHRNGGRGPPKPLLICLFGGGRAGWLTRLLSPCPAHQPAPPSPNPTPSPAAIPLDARDLICLHPISRPSLSQKFFFAAGGWTPPPGWGRASQEWPRLPTTASPIHPLGPLSLDQIHAAIGPAPSTPHPTSTFFPPLLTSHLFSFPRIVYRCASDFFPRFPSTRFCKRSVGHLSPQQNPKKVSQALITFSISPQRSSLL